MPDTLHDLVTAEKAIVSPVDWGKKERRLELKLALAIDGLTEEGLFFRACVLEHLPDAEVMFQLEYHGLRIPGGTGPLCRVEWNPLRPHNNRGRGPKEWRFAEQAGSHYHSFEDNWNAGAGALLRDNLPVAVPVAQDIQGLTGCLDFVGNLFRINNIDVVKTPEWVLTLDLQGNANG